MLRRRSLPNYFASKTQSIFRRCFFLASGNKKFQRANATVIAYDANEYPPDDCLKTGWARDSQTRTRLVDSLICITCWLENNELSVLHYVINVAYITECYIDSRFFLPLVQSRLAPLGCRLGASRLREAARWRLSLIRGTIDLLSDVRNKCKVYY